MPSRDFKNLPPIWDRFTRHSAPGAGGSPQNTRRLPFADITNDHRNNAITKIKAKAKARQRRSEMTRWRPYYANTTNAETHRMCESDDDEEAKPVATSHEYPTSRSSGPNVSALGGVVIPVRSAVVDQTEVPATYDNVQSKEQGAVTQDASDTIPSSLIVTLQISPRKLAVTIGQSPPNPRLIDHPVLRLDALLAKLYKKEADQAQQIFGIIRSNLDIGRDVGDLARYLIRLFVPVKQRMAEKHSRLSNNKAQVEHDIAQVEQEMHLLADVGQAVDGMGIDE